jgi:hypothetical protein
MDMKPLHTYWIPPGHVHGTNIRMGGSAAKENQEMINLTRLTLQGELYASIGEVLSAPYQPVVEGMTPCKLAITDALHPASDQDIDANPAPFHHL